MSKFKKRVYQLIEEVDDLNRKVNLLMDERTSGESIEIKKEIPKKCKTPKLIPVAIIATTATVITAAVMGKIATKNSKSE